MKVCLHSQVVTFGAWAVMAMVLFMGSTYVALASEKDDLPSEMKLGASSVDAPALGDGELGERSAALSAARRALALRELELRGTDPECAAIIESVEKLQAEIHRKHAALRRAFESDDAWNKLKERVAEEEQALRDARRAVVETLRDQKRLDFEEDG